MFDASLTTMPLFGNANAGTRPWLERVQPALADAHADESQCYPRQALQGLSRVSCADAVARSAPLAAANAPKISLRDKKRSVCSATGTI